MIFLPPQTGREVEGESSSFRRDLPLDSVFTHLNGSHPGWMMPAQPQDGSLKLPTAAAARFPLPSMQMLYAS